jgi:acyl-coenzyme A thioesterase PaaI-like protein
MNPGKTGAGATSTTLSSWSPDRDAADRPARFQRADGAVGVTNVTDFLRPQASGRLRVVATAIHQGRTQQLWQVEISRPGDDKLIARGQVRLQNVEST